MSSSLKKTISEVKKFGKAWSDSNAGTFGASVAYYTIFSIAPLLVIAIAIAGFFIDKSATEASIIQQFSGTFGESSGALIDSLIKSKTSDSANIFLTIFGFIVLLFGATGVFSKLQEAFDTIFQSLPSKSSKKNIWATIKQKLFSLGMVVSFGFLLLSSLVLSALTAAFGKRLSSFIASGEFLAHTVEFLISFILISLFLGLTFKVLPTKRLPWRSAMIGGLTAGVLFTISKFLFGLYLGTSGVSSAYGGASALVLFVLWIYYMSQVLFLSAIVTKMYFVKGK